MSRVTSTAPTSVAGHAAGPVPAPVPAPAPAPVPAPAPGTGGALIRRLRRTDLPAVEAHLLRLDPATRRDRFMGAMNDGALRAYARRAVEAEGLMFGAFVGGCLRGVAELRPSSAPGAWWSGGSGLGEVAEAAFAVETGWRRRGLGLALFRRLALAARNRSVRRLQVRCLAHNAAMRGLAARLGAALVRAGFEAEGELRLTWPTPFSLWCEGVEEGIDAALAATEAMTPPSPGPGPGGDLRAA